MENRLLALEGDKELLQLQFQQMSDRIHSQNTKVTDLQRNLEKKNVDLRKTEDELHHEVVSRSNLETRKLELMTEISGLKLRETEIEAENTELRRKLAAAGQHDRSRSRVTGFRPMYPGCPEPKQTFIDTKQESCSSPVRGATNFFVRNGAFKSSVPSFEGGGRCRSPARVSEAGQPIVKKSRGLRKLWSRMRRSHSIHIPQDQDEVDKARFSSGSISCESLGKVSF